MRFLLLLLLALPSPILAQNLDLAFERAAHLQHGINASGWYAQAPGHYQPERLRTYTTDADMALIAGMGFDHVRLSIDATPLVEWQRATTHTATTPFMAELDRTVAAILANHLSVIIDIHPESDYKATLLHGADGVAKFSSLWRALAGHFAPLDPEHVFFEIMNEPEQDDPYRWQGIESVVAEQIRAAGPQFTILVAGAHYSGLDDLLRLEPIALKNVIYTFHDYEPFPFTHQGATWTSPQVQPERGIPYPSTPEAVQPNLGQQPDLSGQWFVEQYGLDRWDAARVETSSGFAAKWGQAHGVPVYCGEFGVLRDYADPAMRARWITDMRTAMEKNHIGWAMWDYQANFGVVTKANGVTTPDLQVLKALGLHPPAQ
jgi:aryl-phospho-beta-D-glucosidase BglC (GH1 family)